MVLGLVARKLPPVGDAAVELYVVAHVSSSKYRFRATRTSAPSERSFSSAALCSRVRNSRSTRIVTVVGGSDSTTSSLLILQVYQSIETTLRYDHPVEHGGLVQRQWPYDATPLELIAHRAGLDADELREHLRHEVDRRLRELAVGTPPACVPRMRRGGRVLTVLLREGPPRQRAGSVVLCVQAAEAGSAGRCRGSSLRRAVRGRRPRVRRRTRCVALTKLPAPRRFDGNSSSNLLGALSAVASNRVPPSWRARLNPPGKTGGRLAVL